MIASKQNTPVRTIKIDLINEKKPQFHFKVDLKNSIFSGFSLDSANKGGTVRIAHQGFYSDYDGEFFFNCLHEISEKIFASWLNKNRIRESQISNSLILIDNHSQAEVFVNIPTFMEISVKDTSIPKTEFRREDIADIKKVTLSGVKVRSDSAIIYIFSNRWRRGMYFNFLPINPKISSRTENDNFPVLFGACHAYLAFPEIYQYQKNPDLKKKLYESGWFPFIGILGKPFNEIFNITKNNLSLEEIEAKIIDLFNETAIQTKYESWMSNPLFRKRESFLKKGIEEYFERDYISAIHVLYPCIEGILQDLAYDINSEGNSGEKLTTKLIAYLRSQNPETMLLLPENFKEYLIESYFARFNRKADDIELSRHSLAHGAATNTDDYTQVRTLQTLLILDQLSFYVQ